MNIINLSLGILLTGISNPGFGKQSSSGEVNNIKTAYSSLTRNPMVQSDKSSDYEKFKKDSEAKIKENEKKITDLKNKMAKESQMVKDKYNDRVTQIEQKNKEMKKKISECKKEENKNPKWEAFKRDFTKGMDEIVQSIEDLTRDYKK